MPVDSYLELFTTLFGWQFYGLIWDALAEVGIVYIPFVMILVTNWIEPAKGAGYRSVWSQSLKGMEVEFYLAVFVAMVAGAPALPLQANLLSYTPSSTVASGPQPAATVASPRSSYGANGAFASPPGTVTVPVWWYAILSLSKGVNHAIIAGLPQSAGIRQVQQQAELTTIPDARLREEAGQFHNDCYLPARSQYLREKPSAATVTSLLNAYGEDDPEWMGSHVYRALYYPTLRAQRRVVGWPYDPTRDVDYDPAGTYTWGQPTCSQWWDESTNGLRVKLANAAAATSPVESTLTRLAAGLPAFSSVSALNNASEKVRDWAVRAALNNARVDTMRAHQPDDFGTYSNRSGILNNLYNAAADVAGAAGSGLSHAAATSMTNVLKPALPMAQALILMAVYALLPFVVVFSRYSLGMMIAGAVGIFTVNFWTVLWKIGEWADENLTQAMHPGTLDGLLSWVSSPGGIAGSTSKVVVFDIMLMVFMLGLPALWTAVMAWVGIKAFNAISTDVLPGSTAPAKQSGEKGGRLATRGK